MQKLEENIKLDAKLLGEDRLALADGQHLTWNPRIGGFKTQKETREKNACCCMRANFA